MKNIFKKNKNDKVFKWGVSNPAFIGISPAIKSIPDWYKDLPLSLNGTQNLGFRENGPTLKHCTPFLDALISGYFVHLPTDLEVKIINGQPEFRWGTDDSFISMRGKDNTKGLVPPAGYYDINFIWVSKVAMQLPKGYSAVLTHPLNRYDLPFVTLSGVVDLEHPITDTNIPFYLKKGFEGIIERGTPFLQVIPFKRENWKSEEIKNLYQNNDTFMREKFLTVKSLYKQRHWHKKSYK